MEGPIGYCFNRYLIPIWRRFGMMDGFARDFGVDSLAVDLEFLTDNVFVVGSPDTVVDKLSHLFEKTGGWGTLQVEAHDYVTARGASREFVQVQAAVDLPIVKDKLAVRLAFDATRGNGYRAALRTSRSASGETSDHSLNIKTKLSRVIYCCSHE